METHKIESRICEELCKCYGVNTLRELFDALEEVFGIANYKELRKELFGD